MTIDSLDDLLGALRDSGLLDDDQQGELSDLAARFPDPRLLARELERRGWLTAYQAEELLAGRGRELVFGQYVVLSLLGEGGMGKVLKARHRLMKRVVALKIIRPVLLAQPRAVDRFHREIEAVARLAHPNIVAAYDADQVGGTHFLVMEYVDGTDLARLVKSHGPLSAGMACECARQAALGLQHAHEQGLVHRDIKPHNLLLSRGQTPGSPPVVKVLDMGLARLQAPEADGLTHTGAVMGTPDFIAPEQASDSHTVDIRADLYSLGCTLYFLLCGEPPFPGGTALEKLFKHQYVAPRPIELRRPDVPPGVAAVVARLMAKRPDDRYQTPAELAEALTPLAAGESDLLAATLLDVGFVPEGEVPFGTLRPAGPAAETMEPQGAATRADEPPEALIEPARGRRATGRPSQCRTSRPDRRQRLSLPGRSLQPGRTPTPPRRMPLLLAMVLTGAVVAAPGAAALWMMLHPGNQASGTTTGPGPTPTPGPSPSNTGTDGTPRLATERPAPKELKPLDSGARETGRPPNDTGKLSAPALLPEGIVYGLPAGTHLYQVAFAANAPRIGCSTSDYSLFVCDLDSTNPSSQPRVARQLFWLEAKDWRWRKEDKKIPAASGLAFTNDGTGIYYGTRDRPKLELPFKSVFRLLNNLDNPLATPVSFWPESRIMDITCVALSVQGHVAITGTFDCADDSTVTDRSAVLVWNLDEKTGAATLARRFNGHKTSRILAVATSADGKWAASSAEYDALRLWDTALGAEKPTITAGDTRVNCIVFSPKGDQLMFGSEDDTDVHLVNLTSRQVQVFSTLKPATAAVIRSLAFSSDGGRIIAGNDSGYVLVWDVNTAQELTGGRMRHPAGPVIGVALSPDGRYAYSAASGSDNTIRRWHAPSLK